MLEKRFQSADTKVNPTRNEVKMRVLSWMEVKNER